MSFIAPEWDNDALGDQIHSNLFQKNPNKTKSKQKLKKKKETLFENNKLNISKQNDENVNKSSPNQKKLKKKLKKLNSGKNKRSGGPEVNNDKQIKKIIDSSENNYQSVERIVDNKNTKKDYARNSLTETQNNKKIKKKLKRLQKDNDNNSIKESINKVDNKNREKVSSAKKKLKKQRESSITKNSRTENTIDEIKDNETRNLDKSEKLKKKMKKIQNENTSKNIELDNETESVSKKNIAKGTINAEKRERKKLKKKLKRLQKQKDRSDDSNKHKKFVVGINVEELKEKLTMAGNTRSKSTNSTNSLREKMQQKLKAARFRFLNEEMYTNEGKDAQKLFHSDPAAFKAYHDGYRQQVSKWPLNPLDTIIRSINKLPSEYVVADFGCGDARLAKSVPHKVHSFDLVASDPSVTACDMAHVPLKNNSADVIVFCLSLMGTNLKDYLFEANRVLKLGGTMKVAEVESRFDQVDVFIDGLQRYGFVNTWKDFSHNLFYFLDFKKTRDVKYKNKLPTISLHPCLYKKR